MKYKTTIEALYVNISLNDADTVNEDDDIHMLEVTLLPPSYTSKPTETCITDLFTALNTCKPVPRDPFPEVQDVKQWVGLYLREADSKTGGRIAAAVSEKLGPDAQAALSSVMQG